MKALLELLGNLLSALFGGKKGESKKLPATETPPEEASLADDLEPPTPPEMAGDGAEEYAEDVAGQPDRNPITDDVEFVLKSGDEGANVKELQAWLEKLGYELTRFGADGSLGDETIQEVADFQDDQRENGNAELKEKESAVKLNAVGRKTYDAIKAAVEALPVIAPPPTLTPSTAALTEDGIPSNFFKLCPDTGKGVKAKRKRKGDWKGALGITLHQTACSLGNRPERYTKVSAHIGVTSEGKIVQMNGLDWVVFHGNSFNNKDVGIEIDGHFAGIEGNIKTYWRPKSQPDRQPLSVTDKQIEATLAAIEWIINEVKKNGGEVKYLHAHRQSSKSRVSDPGSKVWQRIALVAKERFGLVDGGPEFAAGGNPIPKEWDSSYTKGYRS